MARKQHDYHYIYRTTCGITGNFYVGMHSTNDLEDDYLGSGKRLWYSIQKHGRENHTREILEFCENRSSLKDREREIVNENFLEDPNCMNLKIGGDGGFANEEHRVKAQRNGGKKVYQILALRHIEKLKNDVEYKEKYSETIRSITIGNGNPFFGKQHSEKSKSTIGKMMKVLQSGSKNSQFGTCWIKHEIFGIKKIKIENLSSYLEADWKKGRV